MLIKGWQSLIAGGLIIAACAPASAGSFVGSTAHSHGPSRSDPPSDAAVAAAVGKPGKVPALWVRLPLSGGGDVEIRAQHPHVTLDRIGDATLIVSVPGGRFVVAGLAAIFGDLTELVARAGAHEDTDVSIVEIGKRGTPVAFAVTIGTRSGEDLRNTYLQSSVWTADPRAPRPVKVWSGSGGELHQYFDACLFGTETSYAVDASGTITRRCKRTVERYANATEFSSCSQEPEMTCAEGVIGGLHRSAIAR